MSSILSFPERGHWGSSKWRGNCSGHVYRELFEHIKPKLFVDPMMGSGTSIEVAKEMGIEAVGLDLHAGFNILRDSILQTLGGREADLVLSHPPYGDMIRYSGHVWGDEPHPDDLSHCLSVDDFHEKMHAALINQREATCQGGYYGMIIGDQRKNGKYVSFQAEQVARMPADELASIVIKQQHNCVSDRKSYGNKPKLPFITHEYIVLWQKPKVIMSFLSSLATMAKQQQRRLTSTWKVVVLAVLAELGGQASLSDIYRKVEQSAADKLATNRNWEAKIRQTLQLNSEFTNVSNGVWKLAAKSQPRPR